jgi:hypothetical protein
VTFELAPEMFKQGTLDYLDLNIKENADWGLDLGSVELQGSLGGTQPVVFSLDATGRIDSYGFTMTGPPTGTYASGAFPSITYDVDPYGTLTASYSVSIAGRLHVEGVFDADLGELLEVTGTVAEDQTLPGTMVLAELPGPYPKDVVLHLTADIGSLDPPFVMSGSYDYTDYSGGTNPYYVIHTEYALAGVLTIGDAHFDVYGPIDVPEPATVGVFALGSLLFVRCSPHTPNRRRGCEFGRSVSSPTRDR